MTDETNWSIPAPSAKRQLVPVAEARSGAIGRSGQRAPIISRSSSPESTASRVHSRGASRGMTSMKRTT